jgi:thioesterase domain-containing protein
VKLPKFFSSQIVAVQPKGDRPPIFLVHGIGGSAIVFPALTKHLGQDQPLYALQARGLDEVQPIQDRIEDMAATYLEAVRGVQARGPHMIAGYSFGGHVAFEMAQQLARQGDPPRLLAILDIPAPTPVRGQALHVGDPKRHFSASLRRYAAQAIELVRAGRSDRLLTAARRRVRAHATRFQYERVEDLVDMKGWPDIVQKVGRIHFEAMRSYQPTVYPGRIDLFATSFSAASPEGWAQLAGQGLTVHELEGTHISILWDDRDSAVLARKLRARIDEVLEAGRRTSGDA